MSHSQLRSLDVSSELLCGQVSLHSITRRQLYEPQDAQIVLESPGVSSEHWLCCSIHQCGQCSQLWSQLLHAMHCSVAGIDFRGMSSCQVMPMLTVGCVFMLDCAQLRGPKQPKQPKQPRICLYKNSSWRARSGSLFPLPCTCFISSNT